jgi:hypothetical protein
MADASPPVVSPSGKKSVQEELEELRTKGISKSNAKVLGEFPSM